MKSKIFFIGALVLLLLASGITWAMAQSEIQLIPPGDPGVTPVELQNMLSRIEALEEKVDWLVSKQSRIVFTSSELYTGDLGGLAGADAKCQALAEEAGLQGTFKAWISDSTTCVDDRLVHSDVSYALVDGTVVADNWADLKPSLKHPIDMDEYGGHISFEPFFVWTGPGGGFAEASKGDCENWTDSETASAVRIGCTNLIKDWDL